MNGKMLAKVSLAALLVVGVGLLGLTAWLYFIFASSLPAERPEEFSFEIYTGGGMQDESLTYDLENGQFVYTQEYQSSEITSEFALSDDELDYLWQLLRVQRFDRLQAQIDEGVYDRGGTTMTLTYDEETVVISDAGTSFLNDSSAKRFYTIRDELANLVKPYLDNRLRSISVKIDPTLLPTVQSVQLNEHELYNVAADLSGHVSVLPGDYLLSISTITAAGVSDYTTVAVSISEAANLNIAGTADAPRVSVEPLLIHPTE